MRSQNKSDCEIQLAELYAETSRIIDAAEAAGRDLTADESRRCDELDERVQSTKHKLRHLQNQEERGAAELQNRIDRGAITFGDDAKAKRTLQDDGRGRRFAMLKPEESVADYYPKQCENAFGHYVLAKTFGPSRTTPEPIRNAMSESVSTAGGFTVPEGLAGEVIDLARSRSVLMQAGTRTIAMESDSLLVPKLESDATVSTKSENATITASDLTFGARQLQTYTAAALVKTSRELWEDSPNLFAQQLDSWLSQTMAVQIDKWGIQGSGSAEPLGLINRSEISSTGVGGAVAWSDVSGAVTSIRNSNHEPNAWIAYPEVHDDLMTSQTGDGTNSAAMWLGAPPTIDDKLALPTTNCPSANLVVGDFSRYLMGVRVGALIESSTEAGDSFANHQVWIKIVSRFDFVTMDDTSFSS